MSNEPEQNAIDLSSLIIEGHGVCTPPPESSEPPESPETSKES